MIKHRFSNYANLTKVYKLITFLDKDSVKRATFYRIFLTTLNMLKVPSVVAERINNFEILARTVLNK